MRQDRGDRRSERDQIREAVREVARRRARESHERPRGRGRPKGATRERILDIALDLFSEQGYDKTSLREIAAELGFTKAALYYHFPSKEDILLALHVRLHDLGRELTDRLSGGSGPADPANWDALLDDLIAKVAENRKLFLVHERNHGAFEALARSGAHEHDHEGFERQFETILTNTAVPLDERVRFAGAVGVVVSVLMGVGLGTGGAFADVATEELADLVREAVHDLRHAGSISHTRAANGARPEKRSPHDRPARR